MANTSYYAKKKEESDKKIQAALEARNKRTASASGAPSDASLAAKKEASDRKIQAALDARTMRIQSSLPSITSDLQTRYESVIKSYNDSISTPFWGKSATEIYDGQRANMIETSKLMREFEAHRSFYGDDATNAYLKSLEEIKEKQDAIYSNAGLYSQYKSEEEYLAQMIALAKSAEEEQDVIDYLKSKGRWPEQTQQENFRLDPLKQQVLERTYAVQNKPGSHLFSNTPVNVAPYKSAPNYPKRPTSKLDYSAQPWSELVDTVSQMLLSGEDKGFVETDLLLNRLEFEMGLTKEGEGEYAPDDWKSKYVEFQGYYNELVYAKNGYILSKVKMDGSNKSVLQELLEVAKLSGDEKKKRKEAALKKMDELGINREDYAIYSGDKNYNKKDFWSWLKSTVNAGAGEFFSSVANTLNATFGEVADWIVGDDNFFDGMAAFYQGEVDASHFARQFYADRMGGGKVLGFVGDVMETGVSILPDIFLAIATSGTSAAASATGSAAKVGGSVATKSLAKRATWEATSSVLAKASITASDIVKKPQFWTSFVRTYGNDYEQAVAGGASEEVATFYATITSFLNAGIEIGIDGGSGFQGLPDALKSGDKSKILAWTESTLQEVGEEGLQKTVNELATVALYDHDADILNPKEYAYEMGVAAASTGIMGGGQVAIDAAANTIEQQVWENKNAKNIYGDAQQELVGEALEIDPANAYAQRMQGRLDNGKDLSGRQLNRLVQQNNKALTAQDMATIQGAVESRLTELGETGDVAAVAKALAKQSAGEKLSKAELQTISESKYGRRVANELNTENIQSGGYSSEWAQKLDTQRINVEEYSRLVEAAQQPQTATETTDTQVATETETAPEGNYEVSVDGKTIDSKGNVINIVGVESVKDGKMILKTETGTIDSSEVSYATKEEALVYETVASMGVSAEGANTLIKGFIPEDGISASVYANGINEAYQYGRMGARFADISPNGFAVELNEQIRKYAYNLGQMALATQKAIEYNKNTTNTEEINDDAEEGVHLRGGVQRTDSESSGGSVRGVVEGTGTVPNRQEEAAGRSGDSSKTNGQTEEQVSTKELGIPFGSEERNLSYADENTAGLKDAKAFANKHGLELVAFKGGNLTVNGPEGAFEARAYIYGNKVCVRADHPQFSLMQLLKHEVGHHKIRKGNVDMKKVYDAIVDFAAEEYVQHVIESYVNAYATLEGYDANYILEEILCDYEAGMNIFSKESVPDSFWEMSQEALQSDAVKKDFVRSPPADGGTHFSRETRKVNTFLRHFTGEVREGEYIYLSAIEKATIKSNIKTGFCHISPDAKQGIVSAHNRSKGYTYHFICNANYSVTIIDVLDDVADSVIIDSLQKEVTGNDSTGVRQSGKSTRGEGNGSNNRSNDGSAYEKTQQRKSTADVDDGTSDGNWQRDSRPGSENRTNSGANAPRNTSKVKFSREATDKVYLTAVESGDMDKAQRMVDEAAKKAGYTIKAYHGTARADRVGTVFRADRATSGPMAYFTDNKEIAENYSRSKQDTSMAYDSDYYSYETQFRIKAGARDIPLIKAWGYLPVDARRRITEKAGQVREDWDGDGGLIVDTSTKEANGGFQWQLKEGRGNALWALNEQWLNSGNLFNNEGAYLDVLRLVGVFDEFSKVNGMSEPYYKDPNYKEEKVYDTWLKIQKPFDTATVDEQFVNGLEAWYADQDQSRYVRESMESDLWDKNSIDAYVFADRVRDDIKNDTSHAWTSIPDSVSDYLKTLGYDGIKDAGGKLSGDVHTVWIPFASEQIKSAEAVVKDNNGNVIPLSQRFDDSNEDIRFSRESSYSEQVDKVKNNTHDPNNHVYMGTTPMGIAKVLNLPKLPMLVTSQHIYSIAVSKAHAQREGRFKSRLNYHNLGWDVVKNLPEYINKPVLIIKSNTDPNDATFVVVTGQADKAGNPIITAVKPDGKGKYFNIEIPTNIMLSSYGKDGIQGYVATAKTENRILYASKKNSQKSKANPSVQFADILLSSDYTTNLAEFKKIVKKKFDGTIFANSGLPNYIDARFSREFVQEHMTEKERMLERATRTLERENSKLQEDNQYLKELVKIQKTLTGGTKFTKTSVEAAAKTLKARANANGDTKALAKLLEGFYGYIAKGDEITWESTMEQAQPAVDWLLENEKKFFERDQYAQEVLDFIKGRSFYIDDVQKGEAKYAYGSYQAFRQKLFGTFNISENANMSLDELWNEMAAEHPYYFPEGVTSGDQVTTIVDVVNSLRNAMTLTEDVGYEQEMKRRELLYAVYDSYWNVSTLYSVADVKQREINRLKVAHSKKLAEVRAEHKEQALKMKKHYELRMEKLRKEYSERVEKKQAAIVNRYQEQRQRGIENREKTAMRQKIRKAVQDLDKLLNRGNKKTNVKEDMKGFVSKALELADYLFTDHISNDELIRRGITVRMTPNEAALVKETEGLLSQIYDNADSLTDEEFTRLDAKRKSNLDKLRDLLTAQRNERLNAPVYNLFNDLVTEYASLNNSKQEAVKAAYDPNVERFLRSYIGESDGETDSDRKTLLQNMRVADMTMDELWKLHNAYKMVLHSVRYANKRWVKGKTDTVEWTAGQIKGDFSKRKTPDGKTDTVIRNLSNKLGWNYEKLYYALDRIGSETFTELVMNIANSENIVMQDIVEATAFRDEMVKKYGYNNWDVNKKIDREFVDNTGKKFNLTLGELMSLYAYSRRKGAWDHIEYGGFVFGKAALTNPKPADSYKLSKEQCEAITGTLTNEQKAYVEDMQKFLSETMGEKGNEVSMLMYGIMMFGEKNYFPIHIAGQFKAQANESQAKAAAGFSSMSNAGFTHAQNPNAKAPFVLEGFNEIWADHVNEMSRYHGTVPALEDMRRVMNRSFYSESEADSIAIKQLMENSFGKEAVEYFDNLYREANSGAITDKLQKSSHKLLSKFRKNSVAYSLSVLIQQPASVVRAYALIPKKYFRGYRGIGALPIGIAQAATSKWTKSYKKAYAEMLKYAPGVTMAKEIGGFDTATGGSIRSYLLDTNKSLRLKWKTGTVAEKGKSVMDLLDDNVVANLPNVADKIAWIEIWHACKRETVAKHKDLSPNSDAFMQIVGDRFTEVIRATQVYDSIFAKSPMLKSKSLAVQYLVSFMNEANTTANLAESAVRDFVRGDIAKGFRKSTTVLRAIFFTSVLKSIVYAMRDDDEDETYIEKYTESLVENLINDSTVFNYIPIAKDVWSAAQGYDVERPDMSIVSDAISSLTNVVNNARKDTSDMTDEELEEWDKKVTDANWKLADSICAFFGIPMKNVRREINALMDHARIAHENSGKTTWTSIEDAVYRAIANASPSFAKPDIESKADKLYDATINGDTAYVNRLKGSYKDENAYHNAVRKALRENDPRIKEAAIAGYNGEPSERVRIAKLIIADGFAQDDVVAAINAEINAMKPDDASDPKKKGFYTTEDFAREIANGDQASANAARSDIIATSEKNGKSRKEAEDSFASSAKSELRDLFVEGKLSESKASEALKEYCPTKTGPLSDNDVYWIIREWSYERTTGSSDGYGKYKAFHSAVQTGKDLRAAISEYTSHGVEEKTLASQITDYFKPLYKEMSNSERASIKGYLLNAYVLLGYDRTKKSKDIDKWLAD